MHIISAADFPLLCSNLLENALFCQQNALLKNRLFCSKFCRQNLSKPIEGVNSRNVIITQQFHAAPDQANRDFLLEYWLCISPVSTFQYIGAS